MAEVDDASSASGGARRSSSEKMAIFSIDFLRAILLHEGNVLHRIGQTFRYRDARGSAVGVIGKSVAGERMQFIANKPGRSIQRRAMRIGQPHGPASAGEDRGPGPPDQANADDRYMSIVQCH